jgi:hypothetical protein
MGRKVRPQDRAALEEEPVTWRPIASGVQRARPHHDADGASQSFLTHTQITPY